MQQASITIPKALKFMWDSADIAWAVRDLQDNYVYGNQAFYQLLQLPADYQLTHCPQQDLPTPYESVAAAMEQQSYALDEYPYIDEEGLKGTIIQGRKMGFLSMQAFMRRDFSKTVVFTAPTDLFTEQQWLVLYPFLQGRPTAYIAEELAMPVEEVKTYLKQSLQQVKCKTQKAFKALALAEGWDRYVPEFFARQQQFILL